MPAEAASVVSAPVSSNVAFRPLSASSKTSGYTSGFYASPPKSKQAFGAVFTEDVPAPARKSAASAPGGMPGVYEVLNAPLASVPVFVPLWYEKLTEVQRAKLRETILDVAESVAEVPANESDVTKIVEVLMASVPAASAPVWFEKLTDFQRVKLREVVLDVAMSAGAAYAVSADASPVVPAPMASAPKNHSGYTSGFYAGPSSTASLAATSVMAAPITSSFAPVSTTPVSGEFE